MSVRIARPGILTTVQDLGRWGWQGRGVPVAGPMDELSHRCANRLVGNDAAAATLEVTLVGPEVEFGRDIVFAVAGAAFDLALDGVPLETGVAARGRRGQRLCFGERRAGARAYLAVAGGIDVPPLLGSRATHVTSRMGGLDGRPMRAGDVLPLGPPPRGPRPGRRLDEPVVPVPLGGARLRVMPGPDRDRFADNALAILTRARYRIAPQSDRMGYRLEGAPVAHVAGADMLSDATPMGTIQVPASGRPILLMADRQTAGGYARLATVVTADLPLAGQLAPGDWVAFAVCDRLAAVAALEAQRAALDLLLP